MPHFDLTISLGNLMTLAGAIVTMVVVLTTFRAKIDLLIQLHAEELVALRTDLKEHREEDDRRFNEMRIEADKRSHEMAARMFDLVSNVQRLVGQSEMQRAQDRRKL